jgi:hypothetical protein
MSREAFILVLVALCIAGSVILSATIGVILKPEDASTIWITAGGAEAFLAMATGLAAAITMKRASLAPPPTPPTDS